MLITLLINAMDRRSGFTAEGGVELIIGRMIDTDGIATANTEGI